MGKDQQYRARHRATPPHTYSTEPSEFRQSSIEIRTHPKCDIVQRCNKTLVSVTSSQEGFAGKEIFIALALLVEPSLHPT